MGLGLDPVTTIAVICAIGAALTFGIIALAVTGSAASRRFDRRINTMRDRAQGASPQRRPPLDRFHASGARRQSIAWLVLGCPAATSWKHASRGPGGRSASGGTRWRAPS